MNKKRFYIWRLAAFLSQYRMKMSGEELAEHLNRNSLLTGYGEEYGGKRGTYRLISETHRWVQEDLGLPEEGEKIAEAFTLPDGRYAYA